MNAPFSAAFKRIEEGREPLRWKTRLSLLNPFALAISVQTSSISASGVDMNTMSLHDVASVTFSNTFPELIFSESFSALALSGSKRDAIV